MVKFINRVTGTAMWVAEDRKDEYLAAGHLLAAEAPKAEEKPAEKPKRTRKKTVKE